MNKVGERADLNKSSGLRYRQLSSNMMNYMRPTWRSAAHIYFRKLQVVKSMCPHITANSYRYFSS